jgi:probable F420-dependent oxidoreductase
MTARLEMAIPLNEIALRDHDEWFHLLADLKYQGVWSSEVSDSDGFTPLTLAALWEPRLRLGVSVIPVFTRGPALLAMSIAALADVAESPLSIGLGSSSLPVVQHWNGITYEKPYARTRDVLRFVKRALDGEKIDESFETFEIRGFKLAKAVHRRPEFLLGALRPRMLRLAGAEADGAILTMLGPGDVEKCRTEVGGGKTIAARLTVIPTEDVELARSIGRRKLASYLTVDAYAEFHRWLGHEEALQPMWDAWNAGDRQRACDVIPDSVVDDIMIHGTYDQCREHIQRFVDAGVTRPIIAIVPDDCDLRTAIEELAHPA